MNRADFNALSFSEQAAHLNRLLHAHIAEDAATSVEMDEIEHLLPDLLVKLQQHVPDIPFTAGTVMSWAQVGTFCAALPPHLAACPALIQWQKNSEDWPGEIRPVHFYTHGFRDGEWLLRFDPYHGDISISSREEFDEDVAAEENWGDKKPKVMRPLLLDQPLLHAEFNQDEQLLNSLYLPASRPAPSPAPLFGQGPQAAERPPLGLMPAKLWREQCGISFAADARPQQATERFENVVRAIRERLGTPHLIPAAWMEEHQLWQRLRHGDLPADV